ncbi:MAG: hypothetical protein AAGD09_20095 [Cyanobacteria bacterium P01_F01_bin.56]
MTNKTLQDVWDKLDDEKTAAPALAGKALEAQLSDKSLELVPGEAPAYLEVKVTNRSDRLASFQLEVLAAGSDPLASNHWYTLAPQVSSTKPPGDTTVFQITLTDTPIAGFFGWVSLTVRVFSLELKAEERQVLRLKVSPPEGAVPLKLELLTPILRSRPGRSVRMPVRVYNLAQLTVGALIRCEGLPATWFAQDVEQAIELLPQQWTTAEFLVTLPSLAEALARPLPFIVQAEVPGSAPAIVEGRLDIMPVGRLAFRPPEPGRNILPRQWPWQKANEPPPATYQLIFENASNLDPRVVIALDSETAEALEWTITPPEAPLLPGTEQVKTLAVRSRRPWLGLPRAHRLEAQAQLSDERVGKTVPESRTLTLEVAPVIPLWLAVLGGLGLLWLLWLLSWLNPASPLFGHRGPVNSVQFDGLGETLISGSNDQTARLWQRSGFVHLLKNPGLGRVAQADKAIRVTRYRPRDNDRLAIGLENGELQLWDLLQDEQTLSLVAPDQRDDRVLDLLFSPDAQTLFSSHGSGAVLRWSLAPESILQAENRLLQTEIFPFAVYALAGIGPDQAVLAIAGRYNSLEMWNWRTGRRNPIIYPEGGQDDYIMSLATAETQPYWLAVADNQGQITLYDLRECISGAEVCRVMDSWAANADGEAVRSIALTRRGCYLASVGDDGDVKLWPLSQGRRHGRYAAGETLASLPTQLNSVDIRVRQNRLWVVSGADDTRVRVHRTRLPETDCR